MCVVCAAHNVKATLPQQKPGFLTHLQGWNPLLACLTLTMLQYKLQDTIQNKHPFDCNKDCDLDDDACYFQPPREISASLCAGW